MYSTKIIKHIDKELITQWKELWNTAENANVYNSYEWFLTSQEINEAKGYELYTLYHNQKLVAILPLDVYECFGIKVKGSINKHHLVDTPFLISKYNKELFKEFFTYILKNNIYLQKIDERAVKILHSLFPHLFFSLISVNPVVLLKDDPFSKMSPSMVSKVKKIIRKNPTIHFKMAAKNLQKEMEILFEIQHNSSKRARSMDIFADEKIKKYYLTLLKNFPQAIRISFLYVDDKPIAYQYGFLWKNNFNGDQISFDREFGKLQPGKVIIYYLIESLKKDKVHSLDMGGGISSYKMDFTNDYRVLYNLYFSNNMFNMIWWKSINKARRIKQTLFPKKYTRDHEFLFKSL